MSEPMSLMRAGAAAAPAIADALDRAKSAEAERDALTERLRLRSAALDRVVAEVERLRAKVARVEALADRLAQIHNRLHGDVEINGHAHLTGERDLIRRVHDDLRAALEGDR